MRVASIYILLILITIPSLALAQEYRVQLGLFRQEAAAVDGWQRLKARLPKLLAGRLPQLEPLRTDDGVLLRMALYVQDVRTAKAVEQALRGYGAASRNASPPKDVASSKTASRSSGSGGLTGAATTPSSSVGARPDVHTSAGITAGPVPGPGGGRGFVGLKEQVGRVTLTQGVTGSQHGGFGPYAGLQITF